MAMQNIDR